MPHFVQDIDGQSYVNLDLIVEIRPASSGSALACYDQKNNLRGTIRPGDLDAVIAVQPKLPHAP